MRSNELKLISCYSGPPRSRQVGSKREIVSNDDLMYDPDMDDQDQAWVDNIRRQYQTKKKGYKPRGYFCYQTTITR